MGGDASRSRRVSQPRNAKTRVEMLSEERHSQRIRQLPSNKSQRRIRNFRCASGRPKRREESSGERKKGVQSENLSPSERDSISDEEKNLAGRNEFFECESNVASCHVGERLRRAVKRIKSPLPHPPPFILFFAGTRSNEKKIIIIITRKVGIHLPRVSRSSAEKKAEKVSINIIITRWFDSSMVSSVAGCIDKNLLILITSVRLCPTSV